MLNRTARLALLAFAIASGASAALAQNAPVCRSTVSGDVRLHVLTSQIFGNSRSVRVLVPPGYDAPENAGVKYPVLYMLDGQNLFDACLSEISRTEWSVDETVYRLIREKKIPPLIVVGIDHAGKDRPREYLPYRDFFNDGMREPAGKDFPDFLTNEVMPLVDKRYRTLQGHEHTGVGGSSYGGVAALYALLAKPRRIGYGLIESPSLTIGMGQLVRETNPLTTMPIRIHLGMGGHETDNTAYNARLVDLVRQVEANFRASGYDDTTIRVDVPADARHTEAAWAERLTGALTFLFGDAGEKK